jgi:spermidine synthase
MAARGYRTEVPSEEELAERFQRLALKTRYYTPEIHRAAFVLPPFIQELLD